MDDKRRRFEAQVLPYLDAAYSFARWLSASPADADDVVQEAVLRAYRGFEAMRGSDVKAWLLAIVRNCHYTAHRQRQRRAAVPLPEEDETQSGLALTDDTPGPESSAIHSDEVRTLDRLMAALPAEFREILILREVEDLSYREIASIAEVPIGTVMSRLARARAALKVQWLQQVEGQPHVVS
jgi:RNA polymerase sigma-70 factor, ECF subfamily